jgi:glycopeptide antibiotics resistance protein
MNFHRQTSNKFNPSLFRKKRQKKRMKATFAPFKNVVYILYIYACTQYIHTYTWGVNENSSKHTKYSAQ